MTRPMPGPPQWLESAGLGDWDAAGRWRNRWNLHWEDGRAEFDVLERHDKRLTDAECAAHYWQAEAYAFFLAANEDPDGQWVKWFDHKTTWHRLSAYPHALEES